METLNRSKVGEIGDAIHAKLKELEKTFGVTFERPLGSFSDTSINFKLNVRLATKDGNVYSEREHYIANAAAEREGVTIIGNLLGSKWNVRGKQLIIKSYNPSRPKYSLTIDDDGRSARCPIGYLRGGTQLTGTPTVSEFIFWMDNDADDDKFTAKDVDIYDKVDLWVPEMLGDRVDELYEKMGEVELDTSEKKQLYRYICDKNLFGAFDLFIIK